LKRYRQPYRPEESSVPGVIPWSIHRLTESGSEIVDGSVVVEEPLEIRVNGRPVAVLMRTPGMEKELAAGFCLGEGIVADLAHVALVQHCGRAVADPSAEADTLDESRNQVNMRLMAGVEPATVPEAVSLIRSGCGRSDAVQMAEGLAPVNGNVQVAAHILPQLVGQMTRQQQAYRLAGGIHAAAVFDTSGHAVVVSEDIGRHNALDKAMGYCLLRGIPLRDKIVMSTGRASYEMVTTGVRLGVPIIASISSPTSLAVELAEALNCTLLGYLRGKALNVYTHGWRIEGKREKQPVSGG